MTSREALARLPVLRKAELLDMQRQNPPFGGFVDAQALAGQRIFMSPGPIWEPQGHGIDPGQGARAFFAAGIRPGAIVHNAFAYHMTPGGFILDAGARALGCMLSPAGTGNTEMQVEAAAALKPSVYCGTPDFLKVMLDKAREMQKDLSCFRHGLVSGGALFPSLRAEYAEVLVESPLGGQGSEVGFQLVLGQGPAGVLHLPLLLHRCRLLRHRRIRRHCL